VDGVTQLMAALANG